MKDWFFEFITIIAFSRKTQYAIVIGIAAYFAINLIGDHMLSGFQLSGVFAPMSDVKKEKILGKYDKAALGCLVSSWFLAVRLYRKDKKRFYRF